MSNLDEPSSNVPSLTVSTSAKEGRSASVGLALIVLCVLVHLGFGVWQYQYFRTIELESQVVSIKLGVDRLAIAHDLRLNQVASVDAFIARLERSSDISNAYLFDLVDLIGEETVLANSTQIYQLHKTLVESPALASLMDDAQLLSSEWLTGVMQPENALVRSAFQVYDKNQQRGVLIVSLDVQRELERARKTALVVFLASSVALLFIVLLLALWWRQRRQHLTPEQMAMDHQIARLEELLGQARHHQKSMRTASSHAVQLNEQFLRKVGSDLHDGPAQSVSYAILRLREYQQTFIEQQVGAEHFAIVESLEGALKEIRGISKGLVLPELENHSLQQCIHKVVTLNRTLHRNIEIDEHYVDLPLEIDLGVKICVYRFVQEGLNNASRHGQATRCRVVASYQDQILTVSLKDDGMGFRVSKLGSETNRLGIVGLRDRIESIGGKFNINSVLGVGTALKLTISLAEHEEQAEFSTLT